MCVQVYGFLTQPVAERRVDSLFTIMPGAGIVYARVDF